MSNYRLKEDGNLLRSHYYLLVKKYQYYATPLRINDTTIYIHKGSRGYSYNHFTHREFKSLIRILGFKYFNFKFINLESIISKCNNWTDCEYDILTNDDNNNDKNNNNNDNSDDGKNNKNTTINCPHSLVIKNQEIYAKIEKIMNDEFLRKLDINKFRERKLNLPLDGSLPIIISNDSNERQHFNIQSFFKYINNVLKSNVSFILQNCITSVYKELNYKFEFYKIHRNLKLFQLDILPPPADYIITFKLFDYIENIHNLPEKYKHPSIVKHK